MKDGEKIVFQKCVDYLRLGTYVSLYGQHLLKNKGIHINLHCCITYLNNDQLNAIKNFLIKSTSDYSSNFLAKCIL